MFSIISRLVVLWQRASFAFLFILFSSNLFAQTPVLNPSAPNQSVNMTSPNAASLGRYGEVPVNLHNGIPSISVPIYAIKLKKMEIPISLSYHAGGIKVDDNASDTGLGWSLNYGGSVTCAVYGVSDIEDAKGWAFTGYLTPQTGSFQSDGWPATSWMTDPEYIKTKQVSDQSPYDTQPDLFYLNFNGQSTKFFLDGGGVPRTIPHRNITIMAGSSPVVIDEQDVRYEFDIREETITTSFVAGPPSPTPVPQNKSYTYYISKIITPNGEEVNYEYESYIASFNNQVSELRYSVLGGYCDALPPSLTSSYTQVSGYRVKKITSSTGVEINFVYGLTRTDVSGMSALTSITIKSTLDNVQKHSFSFSYSYNNGRLELLSITKDTDPPYQFEYNGNLPARLSKGQDHWGFANTGSFGVQTTTLPIDVASGFTTGINREPDINAMAGMLKKITYPTGGNTQFEFENNTISGLKRQEFNRLAVANSEPYQLIETYFTINSLKPGSSVRANFNVPAGGSYYDPISGTYGLCTAQIKDVYGTTYQTFEGSSSPGGNIVILPEGEYVLEINTRFSDINPYAYVNLNWVELGAEQMTNILSGGVRIKKITNQYLSGPETIRYFNYDRNNQPGFSSGWSRFNPVYIYNWSSLVMDAGGDYRDCYAYAQQSSSVAPLGTVQGGATAYTEVREYVNDKTNGYTYYRYRGYQGSTSYIELYPGAPIVASEWLEEQLLQKVDYRYSAEIGTYLPLVKIENEYKSDIGTGPNEHSVRGVRAVLYKPGVAPTVPATATPRSPEFKIQYYNFNSSWSYLKKKIETLYDQLDTNKKIINVEQYYYDNPAHIMLTRKEVSKSDGNKYKELLSYPKDIDPNFSYLSSPLVERRVLVNNGSVDNLVMSELSTYKNEIGAPIDAYFVMNLSTPKLASSVSSFQGSIHPDYVKKLSYSYNSAKNIKSITTDELKTTVYLWSYKEQYPIAQIKNADYATIVNILGQAQIDSFAVKTPTDTEVFDLIDLLRNSPLLVDAQITSYTYKPLVGMTTETDVKGMRTTYVYDSYQRLSFIKDHFGQIIKSYDYHYKP